MSKKIEAIRDVLFDPFLNSNLTAKEREACKYAAFGYTNAEIADKLNISVGAVNSRIFFARKKLHVSKPGLTRMLLDQIERIVQ